MNDKIVDEKGKLTWFEKLSLALLGEPKTRVELISLLREAQRRSLLEQDALSMIEGVLHVSEMRVHDVMVPSSQMVTLSKDARLDEALPIMSESAHSRFPIIGASKDEVLGLLLAKDVLPWVSNDRDIEDFHLRDLLRPVTFVPESKRLDVLLNDFRRNRSHMAIVVDEYGNVTGLITIEDVLEQIVGDIADEHDIDMDEMPIRSHEDGHYIVKALTGLDEFNEFFKTSFEDSNIDTIGGLVLKRFGHMPERSEEVTINGWCFKVLRSDNRRLHLLEVNTANEKDPSCNTGKSS